MKMSDIKPDGVYRAEVGFRRWKKVRVVKTRVRYDRGYGRNRMRTDGVRVVLEEPVESAISSENRAAGAELVIASRQVHAEWTQEDQDALEEAKVEEARKSRIEELLGLAGYAEECFSWYGEWLMIRGELCEYVLDLIASEETVG